MMAVPITHSMDERLSCRILTAVRAVPCSADTDYLLAAPLYSGAIPILGGSRRRLMSYPPAIVPQ